MVRSIQKSASAHSSRQQTLDRLRELLSPTVTVLGFRIIHLEMQATAPKVLRIFIEGAAGVTERPIHIDDCVQVSHAIHQQMEEAPEFETLLPGAYHLEVSSPGIDRPLSTADDFKRFTGQRARIQTYRALSAEELNHSAYAQKNPRQKNFLGQLSGMIGDCVVLKWVDSPKSPLIQITIPLTLISKANLEPEFDSENTDEGE